MSRELTTLLLELGYSPKETTRKSNYITYFKQSEAIEDLLTAIGAPVSAMELMNTKAEKLLRNGVNRRVNCEAANVDKTVDAAVAQRQAIHRLRAAGAWEELSPKLQEAALLREANPELSLAQLAQLCQPPVTKSSLSHRLRKLIQMSENYKLRNLEPAALGSQIWGIAADCARPAGTLAAEKNFFTGEAGKNDFILFRRLRAAEVCDAGGWVRLLPTLWGPSGSPSSDPARRLAHLPQGKAIGKACVAYVENYRSNNANIPK